MYFDQKIKYLDYLENGIRVRGAGFIRLECWGKTCSLIIQASGLFENAKGSYPVMLVLPEKEEQLSELQLQNGKGRLELRNLNSEDLKELCKVRIPLGEMRQLVAVLREEAERARIAPKSMPQSGAQGIVSGNMPRPVVISSPGEGMLQDESESVIIEKMADSKEGQIPSGTVNQEKEEQITAYNVRQTKDVIDTKAKNERALSEGRELTSADQDKDCKSMGKENKGKENIGKENMGKEMIRTMETKTQEGGRQEEASFSYQANLRPGKWEQLIAIYPPITPFGDTRRYLQISPGDFVILKDRSYRMVNNSFLLHGYFTYRHLILHRQNRRGEMIYYVGVPGRYYDKEKEVAILFGFESFEGAQEPAREGDFGYYMMRVEL